MNTLNDILDALAELDESISNSVTSHHPSAAGLDSRCGTVYQGEDFLATKHRRSLDYYGGFEYIEPEYVTVVGEWTLYSIEHGRVLEAIEALERVNG